MAGRTTGLQAGALVAVHPPLLADDTVALTEPLALALLFGIVHLVDDRRWAWAGVTTGALMLTRPNVYALALIVVVLAVRRAGWRTALRSSAAMVVVVTPWIVRNQVQVGTPRLVTSDGFTLAAIFAPLAQDAGHFADRSSTRPTTAIASSAWLSSTRPSGVASCSNAPGRASVTTPGTSSPTPPTT